MSSFAGARLAQVELSDWPTESVPLVLEKSPSGSPLPSDPALPSVLPDFEPKADGVEKAPRGSWTVLLVDDFADPWNDAESSDDSWFVASVDDFDDPWAREIPKGDDTVGSFALEIPHL